MVKCRTLYITRNLPKTTVITFPDKGDVRFKSEAESMFARYLQFLKEKREIPDWQYELEKFDFRQFGYRNKPYEYTPDFRIGNKEDKGYLIEFKVSIKTFDISKWIRLKKHYDVILEVALARIPHKGKGFQNYARVQDLQRQGRIRRIIDFSAILKQVKSII